MESAFQSFNLDTTLSLKVIFGGHFILTTLALLGNWLSNAYLFYNSFFLAFVIWSQIAVDPDFPLTNAVCANVFGILADIIIMSVSYPGATALGVQKFGLAMAIINLIARFFTSFLLYRIRDQRKSMIYAGVGEPRPGLAGYEDLPSGYSERADVHGQLDTKPLAP